MRYATECSGIEAPTAAWHPLGWEPVFFSEIEAFPSTVLAHHYPHVPNRGDMTRFKDWPDATLDLLCGGTPCQSFSVAGLRKGLDDPRGNLMLTYLATASRYRPRWLVWENVPGVLSVDEGRAFAALLGGMGQLGYGFAYRVLDAQYFGIPQRRRRVFVVGCLGDWRAAAAVLFERHSLQGHPAPSREAGQGFAAATAPSLTASGRGVERTGESRGQDPVIALQSVNCPRERKQNGIGISSDPAMYTLTGRDQHAVFAPDTARCIATREGTSQDYETTTMVAHSPFAFQTRGSDLDTNGVISGTLGTNSGQASGSAPCIAFAQNQREEVRELAVAGAISSIRRGDAKNETLLATMQVRRLTPRECERLQGFEDDYTLVTYRGKPAADGPRYKALGNSMAVPVVRWLGERIAQVDCLVSPSVIAP